eukprot:511338-Prorocentrum_minimum.AAC.1
MYIVGLPTIGVRGGQRGSEGVRGGQRGSVLSTLLCPASRSWRYPYRAPGRMLAFIHNNRQAP